jgi:uncharacterized FAD-dependent dehydrogenase
MQKKISIQVLPSEAANPAKVKNILALAEAVKPSQVSGYTILKQSIDARSRSPKINLTVSAFINEPYHSREIQKINFEPVPRSSKKVVIIGAGPAGLFAALQLIEKGIKPIILERGKDVKSRRRDLAKLNKEGIVNPESNYCFGEGGAGTYSDGKLYTRSNKRGSIDRILNLFVQFGADEKILYEAHPHIGTNKLPHIISAMREAIVANCGEFIFEQKVNQFIIDNGKVKAVKTAKGDQFEADAFILATGHSARDIFELLDAQKIKIEAKPFALGVRVEHPQSLIDSAQYHCALRGEFLPPAAYSWVQQVDGKGVFSFCMCPGGIIAPAATSPGELVVNGWSPSKRNNPYANSGIVVSVEEKDVPSFSKYGALSLMKFQQSVEQKAYEVGGGNFVAPASRLADFTQNKISSSLPDCSYLPGIISADMKTVLPKFVNNRLQEGFKAYGKIMKGYLTNDALVVATESRTSSPVRIPRNETTLQHPQLKNLYPCGEGAGYAGGIVSAAMDGERVAETISAVLQ